MSFSQAERPIGAITFAEPFNEVLQASMTHQVSACCVAAAVSLTELVQRNMRAGNDGLPAWWYNIFCKSRHVLEWKRC